MLPKRNQHGQAYEYADIGDAQKAVAKPVDHVDYGVGFGYPLPETGKQAQRVEDTAQVRKWSDNKGGDDGDIVEFPGKYAVDNSCQRKHEAGQQSEKHSVEKAVNGQPDKKKTD